MFLYVETNEITQWSKFGGQSEKAVLRRKFTAMQAYLKKQKFQRALHLNGLEKRRTKPKVRRRKEQK